MNESEPDACGVQFSSTGRSQYIQAKDCVHGVGEVNSELLTDNTTYAVCTNMTVLRTLTNLVVLGLGD